MLPSPPLVSAADRCSAPGPDILGVLPWLSGVLNVSKSITWEVRWCNDLTASAAMSRVSVFLFFCFPPRGAYLVSKRGPSVHMVPPPTYPDIQHGPHQRGALNCGFGVPSTRLYLQLSVATTPGNANLSSQKKTLAQSPLKIQEPDDDVC